MTVLCRMAGVPARYVEGYMAVPNERGEAIVTGLDAHAWTEVYFKGFGWLTFDATPRRAGNGSSGADSAGGQTAASATPEPTRMPEAAEASPSPLPDPVTPTPQPGEEAPDPEDPEDPEAEPASPVGGFPWLLLLLLVFALGLLLRWRLTDPLRQEGRLPTEAERFDLWWTQVMLRLAALGLRREKGEPPMSFTRRLRADAPSLAPISQRLQQAGLPPLALVPLGECASLLHYGRVEALATDTALARDTALALKKHMPLKPRLIYAARRFFGKGDRGRFSVS